MLHYNVRYVYYHCNVKPALVVSFLCNLNLTLFFLGQFNCICTPYLYLKVRNFFARLKLFYDCLPSQVHRTMAIDHSESNMAP